MNKFTTHSGRAVALYQPNIDTDQIIPKQFLKRIERTGYGEFLFFDWRFEADGRVKSDFVLNQERSKGASILIAGANFGCGSSREHAPWSLTDYGFSVVVAPSFADIFFNNSMKNGLLPVILDEQTVANLAANADANPDYSLTIDLQNQTIADDRGFSATFPIDEFRKYCMINGLDDIGLTLRHADAISTFEEKRAKTAAFAGF